MVPCCVASHEAQLVQSKNMSFHEEAHSGIIASAAGQLELVLSIILYWSYSVAP